MAVVESFNNASSMSGNVEYLFDQQNKERTLSDVYTALTGGSETLFDQAKKVNTSVDKLVESAMMTNQHLSSIDSKLMMNDIAIDQAALLSVELSANGDAKDFMHSLTKLAELDDINLIAVSNGLDSIGGSLDKILDKDFNKVQPLLTGLEAMTTGLTKFTSSLPSFGQLAGIAGGIALMGLSIIGVISAVNIGDVLTLGLIFGGVALASHLLDGVQYNLMKAAAGVAFMGLSIWAFNELIDPSALLEFSTSLLTVGGATLIFDKAFGISAANTGKSLTSLAVGVGLLGVALLPYQMVQWESIPKAAAAIAGIGIAAMALRKVKEDDVFTIGALAVSVGIMGLSLQLFDNITIGDVGVAMAALYGTVGAAVLLSKVGKNALIGSATIGLMGLSLAALAWGLDKINSIDMSIEDGLRVLAIVGSVVGVFSLIGIPAVAALVGIGSGVTLLMGAALATLSFGLNQVGTVNVSEADANNFATSVKHVIGTFTSLGDASTLASLVAGVGISALVTASTLPLVLSMNLLSSMKTPSEDTMLAFDNTIQSLTKTYTQFGVLDLVELAAVTPVMLLMATTTVALGGAINLFTKLSTDKGSVDLAVGTLDAFLMGIQTTFSKYDDASFDVLEKGIKATMGLGKLLRNLAFGINLISKQMKEETDFEGIGNSVGAMLTALTDPLANIGSKKDTFSVGGFTVTNPFSNKVEQGIEAMQGLSGVFLPLSEMLKIFTQDTDGTMVEKFKTNLSGILGAMGDVFSNFGDDEFDVEFMFKATDKASSFVRTVTGADYEPATKGMANIAKSTKEMQVAINDMDLNKLSKLNDLMFNMSELNDNDGIENIIEALQELVEAIVDNTPSGETTQETNVVNNDNTVTEKKATATEQTQQVSDDIGQIISQSNGDVVTSIEKLLGYLKSGQLVVRPKTTGI